MQIRRSIVIIVLTLILLLQVGLRLPFLSVPLDRDEGAYGYMAQRILAGELPYRDAFDHKPPLTYYAYASFIKFFGNSLEAIRVPTLIYSLATTLALFYLGLLLFGVGGGLVAAFLFAVFSGGPLVHGNSSNTEVFMILPLILAFIFFLKGKRSDYFWAGLFSGLAIMFKQVAIFNFLVLFGFMFIKSRPKIQVLNLVGGFFVFPLLITSYFWLKGALPDYIYDVILVNRQYLQAIPIGPWARMIYGAYTTFMIARLENSLLWILGIAGGIYIFVKERSRENITLAFWSLASLLAVATSGLFFGHYYIQLIPGLCLLSALSLRVIKEQSKIPLKIIVMALALLLLWPALVHQVPFYFKYSAAQASEAMYGSRDPSIAKQLANVLATRIRPEETIFVWAADPELYFYLNKKSPTKYFNYLGWMRTPERDQEIITAVRKQRPSYIIWTAYAFKKQELIKLINNNYRLEMQHDQWKVFKKVR